MFNGFDWLSRMLVAIDAAKLHWWTANKHHIDDYYALISAVDNATLKMHDGTMVSFFKLKGYGAILTDREKLNCSKEIESKLQSFFTTPGYQIQIIDNSDPEITRKKVTHSMQDSIDELTRIGLGAPMFTTDYREHVINNSVWKEQFLVVKTSPITIKGNSSPRTETEEAKALRLDKALFNNAVLEKQTHEQGLFLTDEEKSTLEQHHVFRGKVESAFLNVGSLISPMDVKSALYSQKEILYGASVPENWSPTLNSLDIVSKPQTNNTAAGRLKEPDLAAQILTSGATEENLPTDVIQMGERYYSTYSLFMGQPGEVDGDGKESRALLSYAALAAELPLDLPYITSMHLESEPFSALDYKVDKVYVGISSILPFTDNIKIQQSRKEIERRHKAKMELSVYMTLTVTVYANTLDELIRNKRKLTSAIQNWGDAQFRAVEMDKVQGLMSAAPGAVITPNLTRVLESLSVALYQSPVFMDGVSYDSGYLHFFTDLGSPFPIEEQSSKNLNYNAYTCGDSGSGKSTLLTLFNLALLAKPKANKELSGEIPLIFNVDFGKTSFGLTRMVQKFAAENKKKQFICHEMTTDISSAYNVHDLPLGRNKPSMRQKAAIVRFLSVLIMGIESNGNNGFRIKHEDAIDMISFLVDEVYNMLDNTNDPRMFDPTEFQHRSTIEVLKSNNIYLDSDMSYFSLADKLMKIDPIKYIGHAILLRRYAMPRLGDYSQVLAIKQDIALRYDGYKLSNGTSYKEFLVRRLTEVTREYPCFANTTRINIDMARMISIDIKNVSGDDFHKKAIFGSLCLLMYLTKKENSEESKDLFDNVQDQYLPYLKRLNEINRFLPGVLNIEEAHVLIDLFEPVLNDAQRQNRKANWGLKTYSQRISDPSDVFFSLCSTVFVTSNQNEETFLPRFKSMGLSRAEQTIVEHKLSQNLTTFFAFIKINTRKDGEFNRIAIRLRAAVTSGLIWASNSNQTDINFFDKITELLGSEEGVARLQRYFPQGQVRKYYEEKHIKTAAKENGYDSVFDYFVKTVCDNPQPSAAFIRVLRGI